MTIKNRLIHSVFCLGLMSLGVQVMAQPRISVPYNDATSAPHRTTQQSDARVAIPGAPGSRPQDNRFALQPRESDLRVQHNWPGRDLSNSPSQAWWTLKSSLLSDTLDIFSIHGDTELWLQIDDYEGPGRYRIERGILRSANPKLEANQIKSGAIKITGDKDGWLSGTFTVEFRGPKGSDYRLKKGLFRLKKQN